MVVVAILLVRKAFEVKEIWAVIQDLFTIYDFGAIHHSRKNVKRVGLNRHEERRPLHFSSSANVCDP
jgi:hypothetical protein